MVKDNRMKTAGTILFILLLIACGIVYLCSWPQKMKETIITGADVTEAAARDTAKEQVDAVVQNTVTEQAEAVISQIVTDKSKTDEEKGNLPVKVNINTATNDELQQLPGIGDKKAEAIILYREQYGVFKRIDDIMMVPGIKQGLFEKLKKDITVD